MMGDIVDLLRQRAASYRTCGLSAELLEEAAVTIESAEASADYNSAMVEPLRKRVESVNRELSDKARLIAELLEALYDLRAFVAVMVSHGPDARIPETIATPLGAQVKIGLIMDNATAAIAKAEGRS